MKNRNVFIIIFFTILIIQILLSPKTCIGYTLSGTKLFINSVFPSLFPFLVISNMIIGFDGIKIYSKAFGNILCVPLRLPKECSIALLISFLCGYPLGAKYACTLYENNVIDFSTCQRLLNIASNPGPLFVVGVVGTSMLHNTYIGYLLLASCYISCFLVSFFIPNSLNKATTNVHSYTTTKPKNIGIIMKDSVDNAISTTLYIGGFIIFFFVLSSIIKNNAIFSIVINNVLIQSIFLGILEMTNGCFLIATTNYNIFLIVIIISFLITFSGLSVIAQVYSITYKYDFKLKTYVKYKLLQGMLSSLITYILLIFTYRNTYISVFYNINNLNIKSNLFILLSFILILPFIIYITKKLFNIS